MVVLRAEVIDWWEAERFRVHDACLKAHAAYLESALQAAQKLTLKDLLLPRTAAKQAIERRLQSDVNMLNVRLSKSLQASFQASLMRVEGQGVFGGANVAETATLALGGAMALGSLGLAATATSFATSSATFVFFVPVATVSWPLFAAAGLGAATAAFFSPRAVEKAKSMMLARLGKHLDATLHQMLLKDTEPKKPSTWSSLRDQIDRAAMLRLESLQ